MLIAAQCPHATRVAGYRKWQEFGRQVRKGERAIKVLGDLTKKITKTDPDTGEEVEDRVARYPVLSVCDISQTDGDPLGVGRRRFGRCRTPTAPDSGRAGPRPPRRSPGRSW